MKTIELKKGHYQVSNNKTTLNLYISYPLGYKGVYCKGGLFIFDEYVSQWNTEKNESETIELNKDEKEILIYAKNNLR